MLDVFREARRVIATVTLQGWIKLVVAASILPGAIMAYGITTGHAGLGMIIMCVALIPLSIALWVFDHIADKRK